MRIAILGATSQIAKDLVLSFTEKSSHELFLYARRPEAVSQWLSSAGLARQHIVANFSDFQTKLYFDAVINFIGVGNPSQAAELGAAIFDVTHKYDEIALSYVRQHPKCRYIFLSSGAAYCTSFNEPVNEKTKVNIDINNLRLQDWYGLAKLHAECKHRALAQMSIVDVRVFNYLSHTQDIEARFLITDILRAIKSGETLFTSTENIFRDYIGPDELFQLIALVLAAPKKNDVIDCYTQAPIGKMKLLSEMNRNFGLIYETRDIPIEINATGLKVNYFSKNRRAEMFGYVPSSNSLSIVMREVYLMIKEFAR
jgi:nucleoside-diphosphate-sugar epimerase